jgi:hypothetical protein
VFYNTLTASRSSTEITIWISQIVLGVLVLALLLLWVSATMAELEMIEKHLGYTRSVKSETYFVSLVLALTITALGIFYNNILIFSLIHAILSFFNMWGQYLTNAHIKEEQDAGTIPDTEAALAIIDYYFKRPQFPRIATMLTASLIAGQLAIVGELKQSVQFTFYAYLVVILNILFSEIWIAHWRIARDRRIRQYMYHDKTT